MFDFVNAQSTGNPVPESYIAEIEKRFGVRFPAVLRRYYLEHNGQAFPRIRLLIDGDVHTVNRISELKRPGLSLEELLKRQRMQDFPARQMLPFAEDHIDGIYYLHTETGMVWFSTLEEEDDFLPVCRGIERFFEILDTASEKGSDSPFDITGLAGLDAGERPDLLPIGSIVELPDTSHRIMVVSRAVRVILDETEYYYDYGGVAYPSGITGNELAYFNQRDIVNVRFTGYRSSEDDAVQTSIKHFLDTHPNINIGNNEVWDEQT